ncbi:MAG: class II aldolase/adducin family protein, partial [Xanthomonadales bacterium]|nr:class II aldolase/adducin family protein [Xanthomonadales bacterium]
NFLILRNHGLLTCAPKIADAFLFMYVLESACRIQIRAMSGNASLIPVPKPIQDGIQAQADQVTQNLGGELAWPGLLRKLDRVDPSFRD